MPNNTAHLQSGMDLRLPAPRHKKEPPKGLSGGLETYRLVRASSMVLTMGAKVALTNIKPTTAMMIPTTNMQTLFTMHLQVRRWGRGNTPR